MPSLNLDLPQETLDEVSHLAQDFNVHRVDIFVKAVAKLAQSFELEKELAALTQETTNARERIASLETRIQDQDSFATRITKDLEETRNNAAAAMETRSSLLLEITALKQSATRMADEEAAMRRQRDNAGAQVRDLEERDRRKVISVMRDHEVAKLRKHAQDLAVKLQKLEEECTYQRMDGDLKAKKIDALARQLSSATSTKKEFQKKFTKQQKDSFRSERHIGRLMQERARLRGELNQLAKLLSRGTKAGAAIPPKQKTGRPIKKS